MSVVGWQEKELALPLNLASSHRFEGGETPHAYAVRIAELLSPGWTVVDLSYRISVNDITTVGSPLPETILGGETLYIKLRQFLYS